jgi:predicted nucleic acid-binding protein
MSVAYFDSSALVKLIMSDTESAIALSIWDQCDLAVSTRLAYPEVRAGLAAAARDGLLSGRELAQAERRWAELWPEVWVIELSHSLATTAGELAVRHSLTGADSVHLASGTTISANAALFVAWDQRLRAGALAEGMAVIPAAHSS